MTLTLRYGVRSEIGHVREGNEDSGYAGNRLVAVADGIGGQAAGEIASRLAIERLAPLDEDVPGPDVLGALEKAVRTANTELRAMVGRDSRLAGMGTTVTALLAAGQRLAMVHVGDSRCYLYRGQTLTQVSRDHTLVQELVEAGQLTRAEAASHPKRSIITRALDGREPLDLDLSVREALAGDRYLLCSDGLSDFVSAESITEVLALPAVQDVADRLVDLALRAGGPDNVTAVVADVVDGGREGDDPTLVGAAAEHDRSATETPAAAGRTVGARGLGLRRRVQPLPAGTADRWRSRWLVPGVLGVLVLGVLLAAGGSFLYVRAQWYVGPSNGHVAIFRGVRGTVGPLHLSRLSQTGLPLDTLPAEEQRQVSQVIDAASNADARRILTELQQQARPVATLGPTQPITPTATPTGTPTGTPTPSVSP